MIRKRVEPNDIPVPSGSADGISTIANSEQALVIAWKERNAAAERWERVRPLDFYDTHPGQETLPFDELLDLDEERKRSFRRRLIWFVARESSQFRQAEKELYSISNLYEGACNLYTHSLKKYEREKDRLLEAGYSLNDIETVPSPPPPLNLLHMQNGCMGEIHKGLFEGQKGHYSGRDYKRLFCTVCGWINGNEPPSSTMFARGPISQMEGIKEDLGPELLAANPDVECDTYLPDFDLEPGDDASELSKEQEKAKQVTRQCMKAYGLLISVSAAGDLLKTSTQNVSNYIAKGRLRSWPDPNDTRYRLVLREEVETL